MSIPLIIDPEEKHWKVRKFEQKLQHRLENLEHDIYV